MLAGSLGSLAVECPKCGKRSIVERSPNRFDCLNCNFHRALPPVLSASKQAASQSQSELQEIDDYRFEQQPARSPYGNIVLSSDPNLPARSPSENLEEAASADTSGPLIFAAIAVLLGILFL
jgi:ribosomal protein S27AE